MKENSREEDIALIEKSLCDKDTIIQYHYWVGTDFLNAVERIVADYKRVLKENEELKNNTRKNENELEFDIDCDWIALQKMLDESEKSNEYISYKNEKWIKEKYCIPIQKVKNKIEHYQKLQYNYIEKYDEINEGLQAMISALQELLEGGDNNER